MYHHILLFVTYLSLTLQPGNSSTSPPLATLGNPDEIIKDFLILRGKEAPGSDFKLPADSLNTCIDRALSVPAPMAFWNSGSNLCIFVDVVAENTRMIRRVNNKVTIDVNLNYMIPGPFLRIQNATEVEVSEQARTNFYAGCDVTFQEINVNGSPGQYFCKQFSSNLKSTLIVLTRPPMEYGMTAMPLATPKPGGKTVSRVPSTEASSVPTLTPVLKNETVIGNYFVLQGREAPNASAGLSKPASSLKQCVDHATLENQPLAFWDKGVNVCYYAKVDNSTTAKTTLTRRVNNIFTVVRNVQYNVPGFQIRDGSRGRVYLSNKTINKFYDGCDVAFEDGTGLVSCKQFFRNEQSQLILRTL